LKGTDLTKQYYTEQALDRAALLIARYGELLSLREVASVLKYPSNEALRQAHRRGALGFPLTKIPHRRGWFASARDIANVLNSIDQSLELQRNKLPASEAAMDTS
jgi:hypothetical protein